MEVCRVWRGGVGSCNVPLVFSEGRGVRTGTCEKGGWVPGFSGRGRKVSGVEGFQGRLVGS